MAARLTDTGLITWRGTEVPWSSVYAVDYSRSSAWAVTAAGLLRVSHDTAAAIEAKLGLPTPDETCPVPLAPGETSTIACDNSEPRRPELMIWIIVPIVLQTLLGEVAVAKLASMLALLWLLCAAWLGRRGTDWKIGRASCRERV